MPAIRFASRPWLLVGALALACGSDGGGGGVVPDGSVVPGGDAALGPDGGAGGAGLLPPSLAPLMTYCPFDDAADLATFEGRPVVRVCHVGDNRTGCDIDSIAGAIAMANNGDRIEIVNDGTPYTECAVIPDTMSSVEIIGVCGRPHLNDAVCQKKDEQGQGEAVSGTSELGSPRRVGARQWQIYFSNTE